MQLSLLTNYAHEQPSNISYCDPQQFLVCCYTYCGPKLLLTVIVLFMVVNYGKIMGLLLIVRQGVEQWGSEIDRIWGN